MNHLAIQICAAVLAGGVMAVAANRAEAAPTDDVVVSGFNADIITDADQARRKVTNGFDVTRATWFENGLFDGKSTRQNGLPVGAVTSATGSGARYLLRPASGPNALRLGPASNIAGATAGGSSGTLQLQPGQYSALAILAASGNATQDARATGTINYSHGPPTNFTYLAADWYHGEVTRAPNLAVAGLSRNTDAGNDGTGVSVDPNRRFGMWETVLTAREGLDPDRIVTSVTFNQTENASGGTPPVTNILAVSGEPVPEAASLGVVCGLAACLTLGTRFRRGVRNCRHHSPSDGRTSGSCLPGAP